MAIPADYLEDREESLQQVRIITATALFDGHDAAIHLIRRLLQAHGAEVIHLGHSRGVDEIVRAAVQEDVDAVAVSSYQGGHMEYFGYLLRRLRDAGVGHVGLFCGGGGTITPLEAARLQAMGVTRVYGAGQRDRIPLEAIAEEVMGLSRGRRGPAAEIPEAGSYLAIAQDLSRIESGEPAVSGGQESPCPVVGMTGTGGAGKSTLLDALLGRFLQQFPDRRFAVLAFDPTHRRSGGALLGDRIRFNSLGDSRAFFRSLATRRPDSVTNPALQGAVVYLRSRGFDLVLVETVGIGQGNAEVTDVSDLSIYVMTPDYGGPGQLEKIEMLDLADLVVMNKSDHRGAGDALVDVRRQWGQNHPDAATPVGEASVLPCVAIRADNEGIDALFEAVCSYLDSSDPRRPSGHWKADRRTSAPTPAAPLPPARTGYLRDVASHGRGLRAAHAQRVRSASLAHAFYRSLETLGDPALPPPLEPYPEKLLNERVETSLGRLRSRYNEALSGLQEDDRRQLADWPLLREAVSADHYSYQVRGRRYAGENYSRSLAALPIPKVSAPDCGDWGERLRFLVDENLPGRFPYTAGVFPYRRRDEAPTRMFAGEGGPGRTNRRFHYLVAGQPSIRLSTAFDPVTLYGEDPEPDPDVLGRVGRSGVSIATLDDLKVLYSGLDLTDSKTSVSMTINGPAPVLLAQFFNAAVDQAVERHLHAMGGWGGAERRIRHRYRGMHRPRYRGELPAGHDGIGLGLLGISGAELLPGETYARIQSQVLASLRGTLQADILKEDQAQNECIFEVPFALRLLADIQAWCIRRGVKNFYGISVSGYHIAEAGANPVTQLAFTLANGFTLLEYFMAQGLDVNEIAPRMSFFFSNALDPEYAVLGRVARRIWSRALRDLYHAAPGAQRLKYHVQTSGRSLQARDIDLNDARTTLEALYASLDNCNSLHTNAYDEAITTPTEQSVRRALGIQAILQQELGLSLNENPLQGSYFIRELTDVVEGAVFQEFERLNERGGVLGAMETGYQRNRIQSESLEYERRKQEGSLPLVGINRFVAPDGTEPAGETPLTRVSASEQRARVETLRRFRRAHAEESPAALERLKESVRTGGNCFGTLMETVRCCTLGQITHALYEVGGRYRRRL
ncbi:MAG: methylmalonyl-CoA mutase family protein [Pseudomonadota bacterium]|nr:methylmalonyl-CoA mutase family protein [Pseudomonadota bacterium]